MKSKRQTTRAKLERERKLLEKRAFKREKKETADAARRAGEEAGEPVSTDAPSAAPVANADAAESA